MALIRGNSMPNVIVFFLLLAGLPLSCVGDGGDDGEVAEPDCWSREDCGSSQYCKASDPFASTEGVCTTLEPLEAQCLVGDHCRPGLFCHHVDNSGYGACRYAPVDCGEAPSCGCSELSDLCDTPRSCDDAGGAETLTLYCDNDLSAPNLEGVWLDLMRMPSDYGVAQCYIKATFEVLDEPVAEGCEGCDPIFNATLQFYEDGCSLLPEDTWQNGFPVAFGLRTDRWVEGVEQEDGSAVWIETEIDSYFSGERTWRTFEDATSFYDDYDILHNQMTEISW